MNLEIKEEMKNEVMNALAARAKHFEKMAESRAHEVDPETVIEWSDMANEYWALVRQFSNG